MVSYHALIDWFQKMAKRMLYFRLVSCCSVLFFVAGTKPEAAAPQGVSQRSSVSGNKDLPYSPELVVKLLTEARATGNVQRGAEVFRSPLFACLSCHKVG